MKKISLALATLLFAGLLFLSGCGNTAGNKNDDTLPPKNQGLTRPPRAPQTDPNVETLNPDIGDRETALNFIFNNQTLGKTTIKIRRSEWKQMCDDYRYFFKNENCVKGISYTYEKDGEKWVVPNIGFRLRGSTSRYVPQGKDNGREQGQMNVD